MANQTIEQIMAQYAMRPAQSTNFGGFPQVQAENGPALMGYPEPQSQFGQMDALAKMRSQPLRDTGNLQSFIAPKALPSADIKLPDQSAAFAKAMDLEYRRESEIREQEAREAQAAQEWRDRVEAEAADKELRDRQYSLFSDQMTPTHQAMWKAGLYDETISQITSKPEATTLMKNVRFALPNGTPEQRQELVLATMKKNPLVSVNTGNQPLSPVLAAEIKTSGSEHRAMLEKLQKGDKILTAGGIVGTIAGIKENEGLLVVKIAENVKIEISKGSVAQVLKKKSE